MQPIFVPLSTPCWWSVDQALGSIAYSVPSAPCRWSVDQALGSIAYFVPSAPCLICRSASRVYSLFCSICPMSVICGSASRACSIFLCLYPLYLGLLQGYVDCNPKALFQELVLRITDSPKWNPTIAECKVSPQTLVLYIHIYIPIGFIEKIHI